VELGSDIVFRMAIMAVLWFSWRSIICKNKCTMWRWG